MKKLSILFLALILSAIYIGNCSAQVWQNLKGARFVNESDTASLYAVEGSFYYDDQLRAFYGRDQWGWKRFQIGSGGSTISAGNGLRLNGSTINLGATNDAITETTNLTWRNNNQYVFSLGYTGSDGGFANITAADGDGFFSGNSIDLITMNTGGTNLQRIELNTLTNYIDIAAEAGLRYSSTGYENIGDDQTLISKGFANSQYWLVDGISQQTGNADINTQFILNIGSGSQLSLLNNTGDGGVFISNASSGIASPYGTLSLFYTNTSGAFSFEDFRTSKEGITYGASGYVTQTHSLTDKEYVDNRTLEGEASLNFPAVTTNGVQTLTMTVTGAADGDPVSVGAPAAAVVNSLIYTGWVSAANTVSIRAANIGGASSDPPAATFKVTVHKP